MPRILRLSERSFWSSSVSPEPSSTSDPASGSTLNAMGAAYLCGAGNSHAAPSCTNCSASSMTARAWVASSSTPASPVPETA